MSSNLSLSTHSPLSLLCLCAGLSHKTELLKSPDKKKRTCWGVLFPVWTWRAQEITPPTHSLTTVREISMALINHSFLQNEHFSAFRSSLEFFFCPDDHMQRSRGAEFLRSSTAFAVKNNDVKEIGKIILKINLCFKKKLATYMITEDKMRDNLRFSLQPVELGLIFQNYLNFLFRTIN